MRYLKFHQGGLNRLGLLGPDGRSVLDLTLVAQEQALRESLGLTFPVPADIDTLLGAPADILAMLHGLDWTRIASAGLPPLALDGLDLRAPLGTARRNLFCVGLNYAAHIDEGARMAGVPTGPKPPVDFAEFFSKPISSVIGPRDEIDAHTGVTNTLDYEVELAVVIGKEGVNIARDAAMDHVFGYTVANDVTGRDLQFRHGQWFKGKSLDTTCPIGPLLVHASAVADPHDLAIWCEVNGQRVQDASTRQLVHRIPALIAQLSLGLRLYPGDVILTGTPAGVGAARQPPLWLKPGDEVCSHIAGIGELRNKVAGRGA